MKNESFFWFLSKYGRTKHKLLKKWFYEIETLYCRADNNVDRFYKYMGKLEVSDSLREAMESTETKRLYDEMYKIMDEKFKVEFDEFMKTDDILPPLR